MTEDTELNLIILCVSFLSVEFLLTMITPPTISALGAIAIGTAWGLLIGFAIGRN